MKKTDDCFLKVKSDYLKFLSKERIFTNSTTDKISNLKKIYIQREEEFFENLNDLIKYHDSPISTISYYAHSKISKAASEDGYKVILSGTGADEIFSGYYDHYLFHLNKLNRVNKDLFMKEKECWKKFIKRNFKNCFISAFLFKGWYNFVVEREKISTFPEH